MCQRSSQGYYLLWFAGRLEYRFHVKFGGILCTDTVLSSLSYIQLTISGFEDGSNTLTLLSKTLDTVFNATVSEDLFNRQKELLRVALMNQFSEVAWKYLFLLLL